MKKIIFLILTIAIQQQAFAATTLEQKVQNAINETNPHVNIGIKITNLDTNKVLFEQNPNRHYIFASGLKLITTAALLEHFGLDHNFTSSISKKDNDYYLNINDPEFSTKDLEQMLKILAKNTKQIQGNFYIVENHFSLPPLIRTKMAADTMYCYGAPITKVHINKNCSRLTATPTQINDKIKLEAKELVPYRIINKAITIPNHRLDRIYTTLEGDKYIVSGTLNNITGKVNIGAVVHDNFAHVKYMLEKLFKKYSISVNGTILTAKAPKGAKIISSNSRNFRDLASIILKKSDNFISDYLLAGYASKFNNQEWRDAGLMLKKLVKEKLNVDLSNAEIHDGSGISHYNMFTINQFDQILKSIKNRPYFQDFLQLMAKPGDEGTMTGRFAKQDIKLYAKTGSLQGVTTLVGYFYIKGQLHSFVITTNNYSGSKNNYLKLEEKIIEIVAAGNRSL